MDKRAQEQAFSFQKDNNWTASVYKKLCSKFTAYTLYRQAFAKSNHGLLYESTYFQCLNLVYGNFLSRNELRSKC